MSTAAVVDRVEALARFVDAAQDHLPESDLAPARALVDRTGERLSLSRHHTVVALAGPTGTGKSSIFNDLAGVELSRTGVRRPTTGQTHACVWGSDSAAGLLDWLGVGPRFARDAGPELDGLVLLDLPDLDSVQEAHRAEADRLLSVVDLVVWVLNPQKYADKVVHRSYLERFHRHRDITVVVLNQTDLLSAEDLDTCRTDLRRLLAVDGLDGVPLLATSAVQAPGLSSLAAVLDHAVAARQAALRRLGADLDVVVEKLEDHTGVPVEPPDAEAMRPVVDALARAAGVPLVASATERAYVHRARRLTGWPPLRWLRRFRPDPLTRLHLGPEKASATSIGPASPAATAGVSLALRDAAARAGHGLPEPWRESILDTVRSKVDDLADALDQAVARTDLGLARTRAWWRVAGGLQWLAVALTAAGLLWLAVRYLLFALALPEPPMPRFGRTPLPTALLAGGLLAGLLISLVNRVLVRLAARRARRRVQRRLRASVAAVAETFVAEPLAEVVATHAHAARALDQARSPGSR